MSSLDKQASVGPVKAGIGGAVLGIISGGIVGWSIAGIDGILIGVPIAGAYMGLTEAITDARREPGTLKPLWHRIVGSTLVSAAVAVILSFLTGNVVVIGLAIGLLAGLTGLDPRKIALGLGIGLATGVILQLAGFTGVAALTGGLVALIYRLVLSILFPGSASISLSAEQVHPDEARYVVPFEAHTGYVGADYAQDLATTSKGHFRRNRPGIGILEDMESLRGPNFDPDRLHPIIREFYEHTSLFKLTIEPEWNPLIKPFFWVFKNFIASQIGQANLPFNMEEAQRGVVSYIDTIDYEAAGGASDAIQTLRTWIRAYEDSGEAIYVGVYTVVRYEGFGYVSVGFPLPEANFTATLMPFNHRRDGLLLKTAETGSTFPGHYLSDIDDSGRLTTIALHSLDEEIHVYFADNRLQTEHKFFLSGFRFLTLRYAIEKQ